MRKTKRLVGSVVWWALALGWVAVLFFFSGQSAAESGSLSLKVTQFLLRIFPFVPLTVEQLHPVLRKMAHFGIFAVEGFLFGTASVSTFPEKPACVLSVLFCAAMAALNEYSETFAEGRSCEETDMLIDFSGAVLGILIAVLIHRCIRRARARRDENLTFQA